MFEFLRKEQTSEVADLASKHWADHLASPYKIIYNGNVRYKIETEPVLSTEQVMVFRKSLSRQVTKALKLNGFVQISQDGPFIERALKDADAVIPSERASKDIMFIEDDSDLYFYSPGMNGARKIGK